MFWLNDLQWAAIEPLLPHLGGKPRVDDRRVISAILHRYREGLRWRTIPTEYGPRTTLFNRFNRWSERGLWQHFSRHARGLRRPARGRHDGQHGHARAPLGGGRKRGQQNQGIGRLRGGPTTKLHALADGQGRLYALMLTPGQSPDIHGARHLLASTAAPSMLISDKAYDADDLRQFLAAQGTTAVISPMPNRINEPAFDAITYKQRNQIERAFCRLKDWRAIATRYDKTARNFLAGICLALAVSQGMR
ncbi:MAG: family transposase [Rubritepida sp.]|nr:family transposase [Rubritepida sp.]